MGVHGLWELLAPVGRRVSVETLAGKTLAIDASIWMVRFMKAMRDDKGEIVRNAHLIGFFNRICKLLFLRTKPVFVFDGATPALKRRTVIARRKHRENAQAKIRKTAEKLLLNHLKAMKLKELANDIRMQRQLNDAKGKKVLSEDETENEEKHKSSVLSSLDQVKMDEMLSASIAAEEEQELNMAALTSDEDVDIVLPETLDDIDPAVLDALPPGLREQIEKLSSKDTRDSPHIEKKVSFSNSQLEMKDCGMASPIAAEEGGSSMYTASTSLAHSFSEDYENDSDEEMIVPELFEAVDKEVLNSLPISVRLDLFTQMKERQMAENRQIYQQLKKAPEKFSELQIQSYLKAVALRREINQVQKASARRGVGGVQTSRIASEANREFIFSSSYVGNKELLTSSNQSNINGKEPQTHLDISSSNVVSEGRSRETSSPVTGLLSSKKKSVFDGSVQTFLDERGRIRVSRVRAMGIRMTRDLQRNLDLMKEIEQDEANVNSQSSNLANAESIGNIDVTGPTRNETIDDTLSGHNDKSASLTKGTPSLKFGNATPIQISFEDGGDSMTMDDDDDIFTQLVVAGESASLSVDKTSSSILYSHLDPYSVQHKTNRDSFLNNSEVEAGQRGEPNSSDDSEVDWEEGCDTPVAAQQSEPKKSASRGVLEEDADLREAIRRSLEDQMCEVASCRDQQSKADVEISHEIAVSSDLENDDVKQILLNIVAESFGTHADVMDDASTNDSSHGKHVSQVTDFSLEREEHCQSYESINLNADKPCKIYQNSHSEILLEDGGNIQDQRRGELSGGRIVALETDKGNLEEGKVVGMYSFRIASSDEGNSRDSVPLTAGGASLRPVIEIDDKGCKADFTASPPAIEEMNCDASGKLLGSTESKYPAAEDMVQNYNEEGLEKGWNEVVNSADDKQAAFTRANLEEEIQKLGKECVNLGKEQKKLERNADLVTSEMFVECQELLHMFGIPYLIAPMEAEAQCAFMELENLVDGVVTDDSDVLLFGAKSVYKNIFDDRKYVEMYLLKDIEKELGLTREKLISMALLLGSDYTEGVSGIGIVNAIEVVNAFPEEDGGLRKFREWVESPDPAILGKVDVPARSTPKKRGLRASGSEMKSQRDLSAESLAQEENRSDETEEMKQKFMNTHRNVSKNWHFPPSFPSEAVISAYSSPQVDRSTDPFSWGKPDLFLLRKLCWEKFGWGNQKADELLTPVLNEYSKHETQLRLEAFYSFNERFAKIRSKRIKKAVKGITKGKSSVLMDETRRAVPGHGSMGSSFQEHRDEISEDVSGRGKESCSASHSNTLENRTSMQSRKRKAKGKCNLSEMGNGSAYKLSVLKQQTGKRARGKGRKIADARKKKVDEYSDESESEANSGSGESDHNPSNSKAEDLEGHKQVRRSGRHRKEVDYTVDSSKDELMECGSNVHHDDETAPGNNQFSTDKRDDLPVTFETLVQEVASCDYLKTGGGFCVDEDDTDQTHNSRDISNEDDFSQDTHCMDGSFFLNETEAVGEPKSHRTNQAEGAARPVPVQEVSSAVPDGTECQREGSQPQCETDSGDIKTRHDSGSNVLLEGSRGNDNPPLASYGSLRAMPILRRKRRKT